MKQKNEIVLSKYAINEIVKKQDVWLVYTKNNKCWVCEIDGVIQDDIFYKLKLAPKKGKSGSHD